MKTAAISIASDTTLRVRPGARNGSAREGPVAPTQLRAIGFLSVKSASAKPRLAGRQPSNRGGVPRVMTRLSGRHRLQGKRGSVMTGPPSPQENIDSEQPTPRADCA
jgi:hypothetical protein